MAESSVHDPFYDAALKHAEDQGVTCLPLPTISACHKLQTQGEGKIANKFKSLWAELGKYSDKSSQSFFQAERFNLWDGTSSPYLLSVL